MIIEGQSFPDTRWDDFVVVILAWWIQSLLGLLEGQSREAELEFMDGPYGMSLDGEDGESLRYSCWKETLSGREVFFSGRVEAMHLKACLLSAAADAIAECRIRGWSFDDLDTLIAAVAELSDFK